MYIFPAGANTSQLVKNLLLILELVEPPSPDAVAPSDPLGQVPDSFFFAMSQMNATQLSGGTVKIVDSTIFAASTTIAVADVTVEPGAMRELHVRTHISPRCRMTS